MSYQVLARKWRPRDFTSMVGQTSVIRTLQNALTQQRLHHAYLFTGTRGVGKTSVARILAKCLNCETGITATPCGQCNACIEIDKGCFMDLLEIDAASRTKVEDTREVLDNVQYAPTRGRFKIYLIDEVHMLSGHSFNALLKTLEEPPEHVKFLLATTDPQKLPITVRSRCLQLNLKKISNDDIHSALYNILQQEKLACQEQALHTLADAADGSLRDALSLLDQALAFSAGNVTYDDVCSMLGIGDQQLLLDLLSALASGEITQVESALHNVHEQALDYSQTLNELLGVLHAIALQQSFGTGDARLAELCQLLSPEDVQLYYQIALTGQRDMPLAPTPRSGFDMLVLRMLTFQRNAAATLPTTSAPTSVARQAPVAQSSTNTAATKPPTPAAPAKESNQIPTWTNIVAELPLSGIVRNIAEHCVLETITDDTIDLRIDAKQLALVNAKQQQRLAQVLSEYFKRPLRLNLSSGDALDTPAAQVKQAQDAEQARAEQAISDDPTIQALQQTLGAQVQQVTPETTITPSTNEESNHG